MKRLMGDAFVEKHAVDLIVPPPDNLLSRIRRLGKDLQVLLIGQDDGLENERAMVDEVDTRSDTQHPTKRDSGRQAASTNTVAFTKVPTIASPATTFSTEPSTQHLLERIQQLEEMLKAQGSAANNEQMKRQVGRMQQSDIQNRMEDEQIAAWKRQVADKDKGQQQQQPVDGGDLSASVDTPRQSDFWSRAQQFLWGPSGSRQGERQAVKEEATSKSDRRDVSHVSVSGEKPISQLSTLSVPNVETRQSTEPAKRRWGLW